MKRGFTLIELIIVIAIISIISVIGFIKISARLKVSRVEEASQALVSDLDYARSSAMLKGCPVRLVFCNDRLCSAPDTADVGGGGSLPAWIGEAGSPWRYYAFLRMVQSLDNTAKCFSEDAVAGSADGFDYWDFDRRPQSIYSGVAMIAIYGDTNLVDTADWSSTTSANAANSLWFDSDGVLHSPVTDTASVAGTSASYRVALQVQLDDCVASTDDDCLGFLIATPSSGGQSKMIKCSNTGSGRAQGTLASNVCF